MSTKEQLRCSSVASAALMTAKIVSFCAFFTGLIAISSPEWVIVADPSGPENSNTTYATELATKNQTLEITYGLFLFCYYGIDENENWHDKECFASTKPQDRAPNKVRQYFDSVSDDWFVICQIFIVVSVVLTVVCGALGILTLCCSFRGKMFIAGFCGLLSIIAVALTVTEVVLFRVQADDKWNARNQKALVVVEDDEEITDRVSHYSWGWHFAIISGFLTLVAFISFNYAAIKLRKEVARKE